MITLSKDDVRVLEITRQRLYQLTDSLNSLNRDVHTAHPLPSWYVAIPLPLHIFPTLTPPLPFPIAKPDPIQEPSLQSRLSLLATHLSSLQTHLSAHAALLSAAAVFPLPAFPGRAQEAMLAQMLRKKPEMGVEAWVGEACERGKGAGGRGKMMLGKEEEGEGEDWTAMWTWAMPMANELARAMFMAREEEEEEEGDDEEGEEEGESERMEIEEGEGSGGTKGDDREGGGVKPLEMGQILRFMSTGVEPVRLR
ncbi:MAG: hypothetical protein LQ346_006312 [Caloplaca aetnensis]|nr:MAG: hypothetical protein LQ346_006312 [Caloplaca aetnensis]